MLPQTLLCLVLASFVSAQQSIALNSVASFSGSNLPSPAVFSLPSSENLTVSVALCSDPPANQPKFFVSNDSSGTNSWEIQVSKSGFASWTSRAVNGGTLQVENAANLRFEVGVSDNGSYHEILRAIPLFGDSTSNQTLLYSPPFLPQPVEQPSWPNYTMAPANLSQPSPPSSVSNFTLVLDSTQGGQFLTRVPQTGCRLSAAASAGTVLNQTLWLRDQDGWRMQWVVGGLTPATNYTAYVIQAGTKVSGPIYFATKSSSFACPLVHSLPFCPSISYAVPLPAPPTPFSSYDASLLPSSLTKPLLEILTNFTTTLGTYRCGKDMYSPLRTCADCQRAYRRWLCNVSFTRCTEQPALPQPQPAGTAQVPLVPAQTSVPASSPPRNPNLPPFPSAYAALLPCHEICAATDRACPNFLGFRCPRANSGAVDSYGMGLIDSDGKGSERAGVWMDRYGAVWCNGN